ncbi:unnamed protein product, partial [Symbiodinium sp. CCMP2592]
ESRTLLQRYRTAWEWYHSHASTTPAPEWQALNFPSIPAAFGPDHVHREGPGDKGLMQALLHELDDLVRRLCKAYEILHQWHRHLEQHGGDHSPYV